MVFGTFFIQRQTPLVLFASASLEIFRFLSISILTAKLILRYLDRLTELGTGYVALTGRLLPFDLVPLVIFHFPDILTVTGKPIWRFTDRAKVIGTYCEVRISLIM